MAILSMQTGADNPILRKKSTEVKKIDTKLKKFIDDMKDTLVSHEGIGLAAPQVGKNIRVVLVCLNPKTKNENTVVMINPEITYKSEEMYEAEEGCLSLPGIYLQVLRSKEIIVDFQSLKKQKQTLRLEGINARIVQHEVDHVNGILIVDYHLNA
ncbi:peptide deformylase [Candidatus Peregrinibacteria bacterium]|nr:peptide deformylase [Candidatus Peregrinibacteria bacterium]